MSRHPLQPLLFPAHLLLAFTSPESVVNETRRHGAGGGRVQFASRRAPPNTSFSAAPPDTSHIVLLQPLLREQIAATCFGGRGFGKSKSSRNPRVMLCLLGTCGVSGPQDFRLQVGRGVPALFSTIAPFASQGATAFLFQARIGY